MDADFTPNLVRIARRFTPLGSFALTPGSSRVPYCIELDSELKKRKKLEPTSTAVPAASAASISFAEVMPLLPSGAGQSLASIIRTGLTCHQIAPVLTRLLSTT